MSLFYYINLVKHKKNDSPKLLECLIVWNGGRTITTPIVDSILSLLTGNLLPLGWRHSSPTATASSDQYHI